MDPSIIAFLVSASVCLGILLTERWHHRASHDFGGERRKVHLEAVPRIGGLGLAAGILATTLVYRDFMGGIVNSLVLCALPAFLAGFQEDITKSVAPHIRLLATVISAALAWAFVGVRIDHTAIALLDWFLAWPVLGFLFTSLAVASVAHGFNLIDGFNGLCGFTGLAVCGIFAFMAQGTGDELVLAMSLVAFSALLGFLVFNWPFGRLFLGDGGAYLLGFWLACAGVLLAARNPVSISPFAVLLVLAFPAFEVLFSALRRLRTGRRAATSADHGHLHHLIYTKFLRRHLPNSLYTQSTVVLVYAPLWLAFVWVPMMFPRSHIANGLAVVAFVLAYLWAYRRLAASKRTPVFEPSSPA